MLYNTITNNYFILTQFSDIIQGMYKRVEREILHCRTLNQTYINYRDISSLSNLGEDDRNFGYFWTGCRKKFIRPCLFFITHFTMDYILQYAKWSTFFMRLVCRNIVPYSVKKQVQDCKNSSINETLNLPNDNSELVRVCQTEYLLSKAGPAQGNH